MFGCIGSGKNLRLHLCSSVFICFHLWLNFNQRFCADNPQHHSYANDATGHDIKPPDYFLGYL
ncbi:hypothetical protein H6S82_08110 [Planktothrix sp. FACHB-1355]|uniref:Uncharacterized protein n=1 Tax=Aerosakkonema funiforme FACHB-1375 TaxID=2949571 RepID=A0A926VCE1_9CYAN|nr:MULTISPECIES: hypothetical protein [Oscillatoriales]MBD2181276.1 hypothetical protein [Aerosakkonema funiforme FACHB-1375]MBD3558819.1 hypothetical protein [Planktothrix sp. FACHB-1355]